MMQQVVGDGLSLMSVCDSCNLIRINNPIVAATSMLPMTHPDSTTQLRRVLNLPLLTFYGVGVTVGAGIFALIGEVLRDAGDHAPLAFLIAGLIAGARNQLCETGDGLSARRR